MDWRHLKSQIIVDNYFYLLLTYYNSTALALEKVPTLDCLPVSAIVCQPISLPVYLLFYLSVCLPSIFLVYLHVVGSICIHVYKVISVWKSIQLQNLHSEDASIPWLKQFYLFKHFTRFTFSINFSLALIFDIIVSIVICTSISFTYFQKILEEIVLYKINSKLLRDSFSQFSCGLY